MVFVYPGVAPGSPPPSSGGGGGGSGGDVLTAIAYQVPGGDPYTTTGYTEVAPVDSDNLLVTFTAPISGAVVIIASFLCEAAGGVTTPIITADNAIFDDPYGFSVPSEAGSGDDVRRLYTPQYVCLGLTPGESYTAYLGWIVPEGQSASIYTDIMPVTMTVFAVGPGGSRSSGGIIGAVNYFGNYSTTDGVAVAPVDAANLTVSCTPTTDVILVQFAGLFSCDDGAEFELDVLNGGVLLDFPNCLAVILGTYPRGGDTTGMRFATVSYLLNVTPGDTYDITPGWVNLADNGTTLYISQVDGPAFCVTVWEVVNGSVPA